MTRYLALLVFLAAVLFASAPARAQRVQVVINNGLAPPAPSNVIDSSRPDLRFQDVFVRNVGCDGTFTTCGSPGAPTTVELAAGGQVWELVGRDTSSLIVTGGRWSVIELLDSATLIQFELRPTATELV